MQEYVVTLKSFDDLESFYEDMETEGGSITIPDRRVDCHCRRNISRNTHYMLTEDEAEQVRNDDRVLAVELLPSLRDIKPVAFWEQFDDFEKSSTIGTNDKNWGLYRLVNGHVSNWGTDSIFSQITGEVFTTSSGKYVDVVVVDSHINPDHPEFAVNPDGTGGSRAVQYDWFQHSAALGINTTGSYDYSDISSNHGTHVAGTVAGNTQGWARDAIIYNMEFNYAGSFPFADWDLYLFDYIREWHKTKPVNPVTGRRNPTVTNHSWGYSYGNIFLSGISSVTYRGVTTSLSGLTTAQKKTELESKGVPVPAGTYLFRTPARVAALDADIQDAINDGVIVVSSAGNSYWNMVTSTSDDWNNIVSGINHNRGSSPGAADNVICVGNVGVSNNQYKANSSNYGERVDIWAPGTNIVSAVYDSTAATEFGVTLANDPRDSNYKLASISGTSMSGPQIAGLLACYAEQNQNLSQAEALEYLIDNSTAELGDTGGNFGDYTSLGDSTNNRYATYIFERPLNGMTFNTGTHKKRPLNGAVFPRKRYR
jgi:hypothetical protein